MRSFPYVLGVSLLVGASLLYGPRARAQAVPLGIAIEADGNCPSTPVYTILPATQKMAYGDSKGWLCVDGAGGGGGGGGNVVITAPLGSQTAAASVATTINGVLPAFASPPSVTTTITAPLGVQTQAASVAVTLNGPTGTPTEAAVSCGTSSTTLLAAGAATTFVFVKVPNAAANTVWVNYAGATAAAASPSVDLAPGASQNFSAQTGYLPSSQINCIAATATTVTVLYK